MSTINHHNNHHDEGGNFHEGWVTHQDEAANTWVRYWSVLSGSVLFLYDSQDIKHMVGTLTLGPSTAVHNLGSKKSFKFLLVTMSAVGQQHENVFKFSERNERDMWKAAIVAVSKGILADDIMLSEAQLSQIHKVIIRVHGVNGKPPSSTRRGSQKSIGDLTTGVKSVSGTQTERRQYPALESSELPSRAFLRGYAMAGLETATVGDDTVCDAVSEAMQRSLAVLERRRSKIATQFVRDTALEHQRSGSVLRRASESSGTGDSDCVSMTSSTPSLRHGSIDRGVSAGSGTPTGSCSSHGSSDSAASHRARVALKNFANNNGDAKTAIHQFYADTQSNCDSPFWFVNCTRQEAELALTSGGRSHGNVLMRPSSAFGSTGKYVISHCREVSGKLDVGHYSVVRTTEGFKIDVRNEHNPLSCLSDVMDFFVSVAGAGTQPLTTNDIAKLITSDTPSSAQHIGLESGTVDCHDTNSLQNGFSKSSISSRHHPRSPDVTANKFPLTAPPSSLPSRNQPVSSSSISTCGRLPSSPQPIPSDLFNPDADFRSTSIRKNSLPPPPPTRGMNSISRGHSVDLSSSTTTSSGKPVPPLVFPRRQSACEVHPSENSGTLSGRNFRQSSVEASNELSQHSDDYDDVPAPPPSLPASPPASPARQPTGGTVNRLPTLPKKSSAIFADSSSVYAELNDNSDPVLAAKGPLPALPQKPGASLPSAFLTPYGMSGSHNMTKVKPLPPIPPLR